MARWDAPHVIHRVKLCLHAKFYACSSFFLVKYQFVCGHIDLLKKNSPGDTDSKYMGLWVYKQPFKHESQLHGQTDRWTDRQMDGQTLRQFLLYCIDDVNVLGNFPFISCMSLCEEFSVCVLVV